MEVDLSLCSLPIPRRTNSFPLEYGKCSKISYTKVSDKMAYANSINPDQIAPEGAV